MDTNAEIRMYAQQKNSIGFMKRIKTAYEEATGNQFIGFKQEVFNS